MANPVPDLPPLDFRPCGRYEWERLVRRISMPKPLKLLALVLSTYADPDGSRVRPGSGALADVTDSGERTVRRLMTILREDLGLIELVSRGGGRGGVGRTAEYRLTCPVDLLDRVTLLSPGDRAAVSPATQVAAQSEVSPDIQVAGQIDPHPVDSPQTPANIVADENDFHRPNDAVTEQLTGQIETLTGHSAWPTTSHIDQPPKRPTTTSDPAQLQTAREPEASQQDHGGMDGARASPGRCGHGLAAGERGDGTPTCVLCRRESRKPLSRQETA